MKRQSYDQEIAQLLSKFMAGTTSLDEERALARYFRTHDVGEEWKEYKEMFALFDSGEVEIHPASSHGSRGEAGAVSVRRNVSRSFRWMMTGIAASIVLLIGFHLRMKEEGKDAETATVEVEEQIFPQPVTPLTAEVKPDEVLADVQPAKPPVRKRRKAVTRSELPTDPTDDETDQMSLAQEPAGFVRLDESDPFADITAQVQDIRLRGERLQSMVDAMLAEEP